MKLTSNSVKKWSTMAVLGCALLSSGATLTAFASELSFNSESDNGTIKIVRSLEKNATTYYVNGKKFTWSDLSPDQKKRLKLVEKRLEIAEQKLDVKSLKLEKLAHQLDEKAMKLEQAAQKMEKALVKMEPTLMTLESMEKLSSTLQSMSTSHELEIMEQSIEIEKISSLLEEESASLEGKMDVHILALEKALITIANEL